MITKGTFKDGHQGWKVREYPKAEFNFIGYEVIYSDDGECAAEFVGNEDDAKLIAAAPTMYSIIKRMSKSLIHIKDHSEEGLGSDDEDLLNEALEFLTQLDNQK